MPRRKLPPVHPGEILREEFLMPLGISQYRLAKKRASRPAASTRSCREPGPSAPTRPALRLARYFGTSERFWLNLQARYDLEVEKDRLGARLQREVKPLPGIGSKPVQTAGGEASLPASRP